MPLEQRDLSRMLETAIVAARLAGQRAMEEINFIKASIKNSTELVTQADARCQEIIIDRIKENYPDHGFIAEEGHQGKIFKQSPRGDRQFWWAIDPIDGTHNFAHRLLLFTVSIAVLYEGEPIVGVIFEPATDSMYTAVKGGEAQLNNRRITAGEAAMDSFSSVGLDSHYDNVPLSRLSAYFGGKECDVLSIRRPYRSLIESWRRIIQLLQFTDRFPSFRVDRHHI